MLSAKLGPPTHLLALTLEAQDVFNVPPENVLPAPNGKCITRPVALLLVIAPVVSPGNVTIFFSQVLALEML